MQVEDVIKNQKPVKETTQQNAKQKDQVLISFLSSYCTLYRGYSSSLPVLGMISVAFIVFRDKLNHGKLMMLVRKSKHK